MSAYNCSPEGNILQNPQTLFSLAYFPTYAVACIAAPYLYEQRSSWIAQTEKPKQNSYLNSKANLGGICIAML